MLIKLHTAAQDSLLKCSSSLISASAPLSGNFLGTGKSRFQNTGQQALADHWGSSLKGKTVQGVVIRQDSQGC